MNLRPYQQRAVDQVMLHLADRPLLVLPTGAGKTVAASHVVAALDRPTIWAVHRRELVHQAANTLRRFGLSTGLVMAGEQADSTAQVQVASIQTVVRRGLTLDGGLVVIDEAHHCTKSNTYAKFLDACSGASLFGLTATPFRLSGEGLGDIFGRIVVGAYPDDLCREGTLIEPVVYAPDVPSMRGCQVRRGDFRDADQFRVMTRSRIFGNVVSTWVKRAARRRTVVFAVNVAHSRLIVDAFRRHGIIAEHLDAKTPRAQRDATLHRLRTGYTRVVSQCQILTEGWDLPALEVAIVARPTASLCLHLQMLGRIMRCAPEKTGALVLDHAGNHLRHGFVTQRLEYSLAGHEAARRDGAATDSPGKRCPSCYLLVPPGTTECPECGHEFKAEAPRHREGELARLTPERPSLENQQASWSRIEAQREHFGYAVGWSFHRFKALFGFTPLVIDGRVMRPEEATRDQRYSVWRRLEDRRVANGYKPAWTGVQYKVIFGHWPPFSRAS